VAKVINIRINLNLGTINDSFKEASFYTETAQDIGGTISVPSVGIGIGFGYRRKKCDVPEPQIWDEFSKERISGQTIPEYLDNVPWEPYWSSKIEGTKLAGDDLDVKVGAGLALGLGVSAYVNLSEVIDYLKWVVKTNGL